MSSKGNAKANNMSKELATAKAEAKRAKNAAKRARKAAKKAQGTTNGNGAGSFVSQYVNPFSQMVEKRFPDGSGARSLSYRSRSVVTIAPSSDYALRALRIDPHLYGMMYKSPTFTAGPVFPISSWGTATGSDDYGNISGSAARYRVNAFGVRVFSTGQQLYAQGTLTLNVEGSDGVGVSVSPSQTALEKLVYPINAGLDITWVSKPIGIDGHLFNDIAANSGQSAYGWEGLTIYAEGCASGVVLRAEVVMDIEIIPVSNNILDKFATEPPLSQPDLATKLHNAARSMNSFFDGAARVGAAAQTGLAQIAYGASVYQAIKSRSTLPTISYR